MLFLRKRKKIEANYISNACYFCDIIWGRNYHLIFVKKEIEILEMWCNLPRVCTTQYLVQVEILPYHIISHVGCVCVCVCTYAFVCVVCACVHL